MGTFHTSAKIANIGHRTRTAMLSKVIVDTGSECTWVPAAVLDTLGIKREKKDLTFVMANGQMVTRAVGFAVITVGGKFTVDEVVFGEPEDQQSLGARTLEGLNVMVDPPRKRLVAAGPLPAI